MWQIEDYQCKYSCSSLGTRYCIIVINAGTKEGFIKEAGLAFSSKVAGDDNGSMTPRLFES